MRYQNRKKNIIALAVISLLAVSGTLLMNSSNAQTPLNIRDQKTQDTEARIQQPNQSKTAPKSGSTAAQKSTQVPPPPVVQPPAPKHAWAVTGLYVNPISDAASQANAWGASRPGDAAIMRRIAEQPQALWVGGWTVDVAGEVGAYVGRAAAASKMPVIVAYNIPFRDCGNYSAGGAGSAAAYGAWMQGIVQGINGRPAVVILEPDALPQLTTCLNAAGQQERMQMLSSAVSVLKSKAGTHVYLDAGNSGWHPASVMAPRLKQAGIGIADGFALNVSNFYTTNESVVYGNALSALVDNKHYVIDTSRNGNGAISGEAWCNPSGRAFGAVPTTTTGYGPLVEALLWIKTPGQSDGACNGGPNAGAWWADYALGLARAAGW